MSMLRRFTAAVSAAAFVLQCSAVYAAQAGPSGTGGHTFTPTTHPANLNLNLSSTTPAVTASHLHNFTPTTITVNGVQQNVTASSVLTPSEVIALQQVLHTGHQYLTIGAGGNAVGGSMLITSQLSSHLASLVIPQGVTVLDRASTGLNLSGNLTDAGSLKVFSTNPAVTNATISASNINVALGGSITSNLNLTLNAINNIVNAGTISSGGNLTASAGGSIVNALPAGVSGPAPTMQAANNLNLVSSNITNSGMMSALAGNINIASQTASNIAFNNTGGTLQALQGSINVRDASFTANNDFDLTGGQLLSQSLNLYSGQGTVNLDTGNVTGIINIYGGAAHVQAATANLELGTMDLSGDPTFYNTAGNVTINQDLVFHGTSNTDHDLAIVANGDIITGTGAATIDTSNSSGFNGGQINLIAGANFTLNPNTAPSSVQPIGGNAGDTSTTLTITGGSATGGKIDLTNTVSITKITSASTSGSGNGGAVNLFAFAGTGGGSGSITLPTGVAITTTSAGGTAGNITAIAGATTGAGISMPGGTLTTGSTAAKNGTVSLNTATPTKQNQAGTVTVLNGTLGGTTTIVAGTTAGSTVSIGNVLNAKDLSIFSGGNVTISGPVSSATTEVNTLNSSTGASIALNGSVSATTSADIEANGNITQASGNTIVTPTLTFFASGGSVGSAANPIVTQTASATISSAGGNLYVNNTNNGVLTLAFGGATGTFSLTNNLGITSTSDLTATTVALTAQSGDIQLQGNVGTSASPATNLVQMQVSGAGNIIQSSGKVITAKTVLLTGASGSIRGSTVLTPLATTASNVGIHLNSSGAGLVSNSTTLNLLSSSAGFLSVASVGTLNVNGSVSGSNVTLQTSSNGNIVLGSVVGQSGATVTLNANGAGTITQSTPTIILSGTLNLTTGGGNIGSGSSSLNILGGGVNLSPGAGGSVFLNSANSVTLSPSTQASVFQVTSGGAIALSTALSSTSSASLTAAGNITLGAGISSPAVFLTTSAGSGGSIIISGGAFQVGTVTSSLTATADGAGAITSGTGSFNGSFVTLTSGTGNIGVLGTPTNVNTTNLTVSTGGTGQANLNDTNAGALTLNSSSSGGNFQLVTAAALSVATKNAVTSQGGSVSLTATTGQLKLNAGATVQAGGGGVALNAASTTTSGSTAGSVFLDTGSNVFAGGGAAPNKVQIFVGTSAPLIAGNLPSNVVQSNPNSGEIFYGTNGVTANAPNNLVVAAGSGSTNTAQVVFATTSNTTNPITLNGNVSIASTASAPLSSLDLSNATVANAVKALPGNSTLIVGASGATGGSATVNPWNLGPSLTAFNIPASVTLNLQGFQVSNTVNVNVTGSSTTKQFIINGTMGIEASQAGANPNTTISVTSNQSSPVILIGAAGQITTVGTNQTANLTLSANGNVQDGGSIAVGAGNGIGTFVLMTTPFSGGNIALGGNITATGTTGTIGLLVQSGGMITRTAGTLTANQVDLTSAFANIGSSNANIMTNAANLFFNSSSSVFVSDAASSITLGNAGTGPLASSATVTATTTGTTLNTGTGQVQVKTLTLQPGTGVSNFSINLQGVVGTSFFPSSGGVITLTASGTGTISCTTCSVVGTSVVLQTSGTGSIGGTSPATAISVATPLLTVSAPMTTGANGAYINDSLTASLGASTVGGTLNVADSAVSGTLTVSGTVSAQTVNLSTTSGGNIVLAAGVGNTLSGSSTTIIANGAGSITQSAGTFTVQGATINLGNNASTGNIGTSTNARLRIAPSSTTPAVFLNTSGQIFLATTALVNPLGGLFVGTTTTPSVVNVTSSGALQTATSFSASATTSISLQSTGAMTLGSSVFAPTVTLNAGGDITELNSNAVVGAGTSNVSLTATSGSIGTPSQSINVGTNAVTTLTVSAPSGSAFIGYSGSALNFNQSNAGSQFVVAPSASATGVQTLNVNGAVTAGTVNFTSGGALNVNSSSPVSAMSVTLAAASGANLSLGAAVGKTGGGTVLRTAGTGAIVNNAGANVIGTTVTLTNTTLGSGNIGIASGNPLQTQATTLFASTGGNVFISNTGPVTIGASSAGNSNTFQVTSTGSLTTSGLITGGTITLTSGTNAALTIGANLGDINATAINLTAGGSGNITETGTASVSGAANLVLQMITGTGNIGTSAATPINFLTQAANPAMTVLGETGPSGSGNVYLKNLSAGGTLLVDGFAGNTAGSFQASTAGAMNLNGITGSSILLQTTGASAGNINVNFSVTIGSATTKSVTLSAGGIAGTAAITQTNTVAGVTGQSVTLSSGSGGLGSAGTAIQIIPVSPATTLTATTGGSAFLKSSGPIIVGASSAQAFTLTATGGTITQAAGATLTAPTISLTATGGDIGTAAQAFKVLTGNMTVTANNVFLTNTGSLSLNGSFSSLTASVMGAGSTLTVMDSSGVALGNLAAVTSVSVTSTGSITALSPTATITAPQVSLNGTNLGMSASAPLKTVTANLSLQGAGQDFVANTGSVALTWTGTANTLNLTTSGSLTSNSNVSATNLILTSTGGSIGTQQFAIQVIATNLTVNASTNVFLLDESNSVTVANSSSAGSTFQLQNNMGGITVNAPVMGMTVSLEPTAVGASLSLNAPVGKSGGTTMLTTHGAGNITGTASANVIGTTVTLNSGVGNIGSGTALNTQATTLTANAGGSGTVNIANTGILTLGASSAGGSFSLTSTGNITTSGAVTGSTVSLVGTGSGNVGITLGANVGNASTSQITLTALGTGSITESSPSAVVSGNGSLMLSLQSGTGSIGMSGTSPFAFSANTITNAFTGGTGSVYLKNTATSGTVTLQGGDAGSTFQMSASANLNINNTVIAPIIILQTTANNGGIALTNGSLGSSGVTKSVTVSANGSGSITDPGMNVLANTVTLSSSSGSIGAPGAAISLNTTFTPTVVSANTGGSGNVYLFASGAVTVNTSTAGGEFQLTANGQTSMSSGATIVAPQVTLQALSGSNGGIALNGNVGAAGGTTTLTADGTGNITQTTGTVLGANEFFASGTGNIGTSGQIIKTAATIMSANTGGTGNVFLANTLPANGSLTLNSSNAGGAFSLMNSVASGNGTTLTVNNVSSGAGSLTLVTNNGTLAINNGSTLNAIGGNLTIQNSNSGTGFISIGSSVNILSFFSGKVSGTLPTAGGNVSIFLGGSATQVPGTTPTNVTPSTSGGGKIFFGTNSIQGPASTPNATVNAIGATVTFSGARTGGAGISVGSSTSITGDPPASSSLPALTVPPITGGVSNTTPGLGTTNPSAQFSQSSNSTSSAPVTSPVPVSSTNNSVSSNSLIPIAYTSAAGAATNRHNRLPLMGQIETNLAGGSQPTSAFVQAGSNLQLAEGTALVAGASGSSSVVLPEGNVSIKPGSLAYVFTDGSTTAVLNMHDNGTGSVTLTINGQSISVAPGKAVVFSYGTSSDFGDANPLSGISYRNVKHRSTGNAHVFTADFSMTTALGSIGSLRGLVNSKNPQDQKLARQLLKTAAALTLVKAGGQPYVRYNHKALLSQGL